MSFKKCLSTLTTSFPKRRLWCWLVWGIGWMLTLWLYAGCNYMIITENASQCIFSKTMCYISCSSFYFSKHRGDENKRSISHYEMCRPINEPFVSSNTDDIHVKHNYGSAVIMWAGSCPGSGLMAAEKKKESTCFFTKLLSLMSRPNSIQKLE